MKQAILVVIGGGIGSLLRYWMSIGIYLLVGRSFPYSTLTVNVLGSFVMGFLTIFFVERLSGSVDYWRALLLVGFLGGFTTFSSFSIETFELFERAEIIKGILNIVGSVGLCMLAVSFGVLLGKQV